MTRDQLEHIIRASANLTNLDEIVVIGSQAILGQFPNAPEELRVSMEADIYPLRDPSQADLIDGTIGELSPFHETFGYYGQGVGPETATLPEGWQSRLIDVANENTRGARGLCLEVHDLAISKLVAGREKDLEFCSLLARFNMVSLATLHERLAETSVDDAVATSVSQRIQNLE